jgi:hypothetical protein
MEILLYAFLCNLEFGFVQNESSGIRHLPGIRQYSPGVLQKLGGDGPANGPMAIRKEKIENIIFSKTLQHKVRFQDILKFHLTLNPISFIENHLFE